MSEHPIIACGSCGRKYRVRDERIESFRCRHCGEEVSFDPDFLPLTPEERALQEDAEIESIRQKLRPYVSLAFAAAAFTVIFTLIANGSQRRPSVVVLLGGCALAVSFAIAGILMRKYPGRGMTCFAILASMTPLGFGLWFFTLPESTTRAMSGLPLVMLLTAGGVGTLLFALYAWSMVPVARALEERLER